MATKIVIYGSTGHAQSFADAILQRPHDYDCEVSAYIDDYIEGEGRTIDGVPIIAFDKWRLEYSNVPVFVTIGAPAGRRRLVNRVQEYGSAVPKFPIKNKGIGRNFLAGDSTFIAHPIYIGPNVKVGNHVQLQPMLHLGHDCVLGDYVTVSAAHIAGNVHIEDDVFIGMGATIVHGSTKHPIVIGRGSTVGAGAVVTKSVRPEVKVLGNPAEELRILAARRPKRVLRR